MAQKFKVGDKVYYPKFSTKIFTLSQYNHTQYPIKIEELGLAFTKQGQYSKKDIKTGIVLNASIFLATKENHKLLEQLYGIKFEEPKSFIEEHISNGSRVLCLVSLVPIEQRPNKIWKVKNSIRVICAIDKRHIFPYKATNGMEFQYAYPIAVDEKGNITYLDD